MRKLTCDKCKKEGEDYNQMRNRVLNDFSFELCPECTQDFGKVMRDETVKMHNVVIAWVKTPKEVKTV